MVVGLCHSPHHRLRDQDGRGFPEAAAVLGADFAGALVRNGWAPYRQFDQAAHQTCLAHHATSGLCRRPRRRPRDRLRFYTSLVAVCVR